jgi:hypothetical protein
MNHTAYELALIRRDQLLREAADRRLATELAASAHGAPSGGSQSASPHRLPRVQWRFRTSQVPPRLTARGH